MTASSKSLQADFSSAYQEAYSAWRPWLQEAQKDMRIYLGDQFSAEDLAYLRKQQRNAMVYNTTARNVNNLAGYQRGQRMGMACDPQEGSDQETSDLFSDLLNWQMVSSNAYNTLSDSFKLGSCITGMNMLSLWMDYLKDPINGSICISRESHKNYLIDPNWQGDFDMKSCRYLQRRRYTSNLQTQGLLPEHRKEIAKMQGGYDDGKYPMLTSLRSNAESQLLVYDEHWKRVARPIKILIDGMSGQTRIWQGSSNALREFQRRFPFVQAMNAVQEGVELTVFVNGEPFYNGRDPYGLNDYPFVPVIGYHVPEHEDMRYRCQGIVRCMRDPQIDLNRLRSKYQDMINSHVASGWIAKNGAVQNPLDLKKTGQGVNIIMSRDAQLTDIAPIQPRDIPQTWILYSDQIRQDIDNICGINNENLGMQQRGGDAISGTAVKMRMAAGRTTVGELLDNLDLTQKQLGQKIIALIQKNWSPEKVARITGKEPTREFYNQEFGTYDCVVKQTDLTDTQRTLSFVQTVQAMQMGIQIPQRFALQQLPIANKTDLLKAFDQENQERQQTAQMQQQEQLLKQQLDQAKVVSDLSLAAERRSRMIADEALARSRLSNADLERAKTVLEEIKAGKEIQSMDLNLLNGVLDFVRQAQSEHAARDKADIEAASQRALEQTRVDAPQQVPTENQVIGGNFMSNLQQRVEQQAN